MTPTQTEALDTLETVAAAIWDDRPRSTTHETKDAYMVERGPALVDAAKTVSVAFEGVETFPDVRAVALVSYARMVSYGVVMGYLDGPRGAAWETLLLNPEQAHAHGVGLAPESRNGAGWWIAWESCDASSYALPKVVAEGTLETGEGFYTESYWGWWDRLYVVF